MQEQKRSQTNKVNNMKRSFFLLAILLLLGRSASAIGGIDLSIGPKVGYLSEKLSYQKADIKNGFSNHFVFGVFGRVQFDNLYIQPELICFKTSNIFDISVDTTNVSGTSIPSEYNFTMTQNAMNIQIPLLVGYKFSISERIALRAQAGPTANFILPSKTLVEESGSVRTNDILEKLKDAEFDTKAVAWGIQVGAGLDVLRFTLDINYNLGITKMFGEDVINNTELGEYIDTQNIEKTRQNLFMVTIGYKLL